MRFWRRAMIPTLCVLLCGMAQAQDVNEVDIYLRLDDQQSAKVGQGWSTIDGRPRSVCMLGAERIEPVDKYDESYWDYVENRRSSKTRGSAGSANLDITYKAVSFGLSGTRGGGSVVSSTSTHEDAGALIRHVKQKRVLTPVDGSHLVKAPPPTEPTKPAKPTDPAPESRQITVFTGPAYRLNSSAEGMRDWSTFHRTCGDRYVAEIIDGGELSVLMSRQFETFDSRITYARSRSGSFGIGKLFSLGGSSSSSGEDTKHFDKTRTTVLLTEHADATGTKLITDLASLKENLEGYRVRSANVRAPLYARLTPYTGVGNYRVEPRTDDAIARLQQLIQAHARFSFIEDTAKEAIRDRGEGTPDKNLYLSRVLIDGPPEPLDAVQTAARETRQSIERAIAELTQCISASSVCTTRKEWIASSDGEGIPSDYALRLLLPVPTSKVPTKLKAVLVQGAASPRANDALREQKQRLYELLLRRVWVENTARARCDELDECDPSGPQVAQLLELLTRSTTGQRNDGTWVEDSKIGIHLDKTNGVEFVEKLKEAYIAELGKMPARPEEVAVVAAGSGSPASASGAMEPDDRSGTRTSNASRIESTQPVDVKLPTDWNTSLKEAVL